MLAVDDVHVLATDPHAVQELATLCTGLRERNRQVLLAGEADAAPNGSIGEALRMQFECGLTAPPTTPNHKKPQPNTTNNTVRPHSNCIRSASPTDPFGTTSASPASST